MWRWRSDCGCYQVASPGACRPSGRKAKTGQRSTRLMCGEVSPVQSSDQRENLLGWPASAVDHHEVLMERLGQFPVKGCLDAPWVQVVPVA